jgi:hypothetical protein
MITNINTGVDPARIQQGEPSFFVNWTENGKNNYFFFNQRWAADRFEQRLKTRQVEEYSWAQKVENYNKTGSYYQ